MKETIEDINADIELQYGKKNMDDNIAYILSLLEARMKDGVLDDNIPVPSHEAAAKTILLLLDRPELSWETICRENRVRNVMEYLFIRAHNHYDEVHDFVCGLLRNIAHAIVITEFGHISKTAYNNYLHERFTDKEKNRTIGTLPISNLLESKNFIWMTPLSIQWCHPILFAQ